MKPRLAIVSDLWGFNNDSYINLYIEELYNYFDVDLIDAQVLGDVNRNQDKQLIHKQFMSSGIDLAASRLAKAHIHFDILLGFNIGGTIGWEAIQLGAKIDSLITVSTTHFKTKKNFPSKSIKLYLGEAEKNISSEKWLQELGLSYSIRPSYGNLIYNNEAFINELCTELTESYSTKNDCCE